MGELFDRRYEWFARPAGKSATIKAGMHRPYTELPKRWSSEEVEHVREMLHFLSDDEADVIIDSMQQPPESPVDIILCMGGTALNFESSTMNPMDPEALSRPE